MAETSLLAKLLDAAPEMVALIIIVVLFLRYLNQERSSWQAFIKATSDSMVTAFDKVALKLDGLTQRVNDGFNAIDQRLTKIEDCIDDIPAAEEPKTQPRKR